MRKLCRHLAGVTSVTAVALSLMNGSAQATPDNGAASWTQSTTVETGFKDTSTLKPIEGAPLTEAHSGSGTTWAPGGAGATNTIFVSGSGLHVNSATAAYQARHPISNACADIFEISYYERGRRKVETRGHKCGLQRTTTTFHINRSLDNNQPFCGRVKVGGSWSNYACVTIKR